MDPYAPRARKADENVSAAPSNGINPCPDQHYVPQSRWARVKNQEFPSAALEKLGVPWRQAEGKQNHIIIDREFAMALRKARAQPQSGNMERSPLEIDGTSTGDLNHPETILLRTVHEQPIGREEIVMRRESPHRPLPRQTNTGITDRGDRNSLPQRERSMERIDLRSTSERNGRTYYEEILIDHDKKSGSEAQSAAPKTATGKVTAPGQEAFRRDIQEEAEFYNKRIEERSIVGKATNGATHNLAIIDIPPGTKKIAMNGVGGGRLEVTWQSYSGVSRSKFYQDGIANEETVHSGEPTWSAEGTLRFDRASEATELELEREPVKGRIQERQKEQGKEPEKDREK